MKCSVAQWLGLGIRWNRFECQLPYSLYILEPKNLSVIRNIIKVIKMGHRKLKIYIKNIHPLQDYLYSRDVKVKEIGWDSGVISPNFRCFIYKVGARTPTLLGYCGQV